MITGLAHRLATVQQLQANPQHLTSHWVPINDRRSLRCITVLFVYSRLKNSLIYCGKLVTQPFELWHIIDDDIGISRMKGEIILVILLRRIELLQRHDLCYDRRIKFV